MLTIKEIWHETLHNHYGQYFSISKIIYKKTTNYQDLLIIKNKKVGKVLILDGIVQLTELDEFIYHEMMTSIPIIAHGNVKKVLIIGGGDGGILREVSKYLNIKQITMVEIDEDVIIICKKYLSKFQSGAFLDQRLLLIIQNGIEFLNSCNDKFDLIISDSTDPVGPGKELFTNEFYKNCARCLNNGGIFIAQNGISFLQQDEIYNSYKLLTRFFNDVTFYQATIPTYYGGIMLFAWATQNCNLRKINNSLIVERLQKNNITYRYYNAEIHKSSFVLPQYLINCLNN